MTGTCPADRDNQRCPSNPDNQRCHSNRDNSTSALSRSGDVPDNELVELELLVDVCGCRHADECDRRTQGDRCVMASSAGDDRRREGVYQVC